MEKMRKLYTYIVHSIRGKIFALGCIAIFTSIIVGYVGLSAVNRNNRNVAIETDVNQIKMLQSSNESNNVLYQYHLDSLYLNNIVENFDSMDKLAEEVLEVGKSSYKNQIGTIRTTITTSKENTQQITEKSEQRGFNSSTGKYADFTDGNTELISALEAFEQNKSWVDTNWTEVNVTNTNTTIDGKDYVKYTYTASLPQVGKRDVFVIRVGGTAIEYKKSFFIQNLTFRNSNSDKTIDFSALSKNELQSSYGEALSSVDMSTLNAKNVVKVDANFTASNATWEECAIKIPIQNIEIQEYDTVTYTILLEKNAGTTIQIGGALNELYAFSKAFLSLEEKVALYSQLVVEGSDVTDSLNEVENLMTTITENVARYSVDSGVVEELTGKMQQKKETLDVLKDLDSEILNLKKENTELSNTLTELISGIKENVEKDMKWVKSSVQGIILILIILTSIIIILITIVISKGIDISMSRFSSTLNAVSEGNIEVRAEITGQNEFSEFGVYLNRFLDKLSGIIFSLQSIADTLSKSGDALEERANDTSQVAEKIGRAVNDISLGAASQAEDVEKSSLKIGEMGSLIVNIMDNIQVLSENTLKMQGESEKSEKIMQSLSNSNEKTMGAFQNIDQQIRMTDKSVQDIHKAVSLISSIAEETNLLALNASIEAARAGELGKGFAVVASEIQKLAEQSNSSAKIIENIIAKLSEESKLTVESIDEITGIINVQKEELSETQERFSNVKQEIENTGIKMEHVLTEVDQCNQERGEIVEVITNLAAIAEENAASTEQTNGSMIELNDAMEIVTETAKELRELSEKLKLDLAYFRTE